MEGISQVQVATPQLQKRSNKHVLTAVGCAGTLGVATGCIAHQAVKKDVKSIEQKIKDGKDMLKASLEKSKKSLKTIGLKTGATVALGTLFIFSLFKIMGDVASSHNKEN
jgi:hypothetical protein